MEKKKVFPKNVEYEYEIVQCGMRQFPKNQVIRLVWAMGVLGGAGVADSGLVLVSTWSCFSFLIHRLNFSISPSFPLFLLCLVRLGTPWCWGCHLSLSF